MRALGRELLTDAVIGALGNLAAAARQLGISERTMGLRVRKYGIDAGRYRYRSRGMSE